MAIWRQKEPEVRTIPYSYRVTGVPYGAPAIDSTANYMTLNSLEHCICQACTTSTTIRWDSNPIPLSFEPQPD